MVKDGDAMGIELKIARLKKGIKQKELAKVTGVSQQYITALENGKTGNPTRKVMLSISNALGTSVQELFFSEEQTNQTH